MTESHHTEEIDGELDFVQILCELYRRKWLVLGVTLVTGFVAAAFTLRMPNIYESSAALIIREPRRAINLDPESSTPADSRTLSVETLQSLAESTDIIWILFEGLWENKTLEKWKLPSLDKQEEFGIFQHSLSTELKKQKARTGNSVALLPILVLTARAQSPVDALVVANEWAKIVEAKSREVYTEGVGALAAFIGDMYKLSNDTLVKYEDDLAAKTLEAGLNLKTVRLKMLNAKAVALEQDVLDLRTDIKINHVVIVEGKRRVLEQQIKGEWIGMVAEKVLRGGEDPFDEEKLSAQAQKAVTHVRQYIRQSDSLRAYRKEHNLLTKKAQFSHYRRDIDRILAERAIVNDEIPSLRARLAALREQIKTIPEKITLEKAITNDALWNAHINNTLPQNVALDRLKSESINPLYQSTKELIVNGALELETIKSKFEQLGKSTDIATLRIADLESEIDVISRETTRRERELQEATHGLIRMFREDYLAELLRVEDFLMQEVRKHEELKVKEELRKTIGKEIDLLEKTISKYELELEVLAREVNKTKGIQTALSSKAEEIALLQISVENASRTGTAILYKAQANPLKIAPARSKLVLISMLVAFVVCASLVCSANVIQRQAGKVSKPVPLDENGVDTTPSMGKNIPIVMVTSESEKTRILEALKTGANSYIVRPSEFDIVVKKVKDSLG